MSQAAGESRPNNHYWVSIDVTAVDGTDPRNTDDGPITHAIKFRVDAPDAWTAAHKLAFALGESVRKNDEAKLAHQRRVSRWHRRAWATSVGWLRSQRWFWTMRKAMRGTRGGR